MRYFLEDIHLNKIQYLQMKSNRSLKVIFFANSWHHTSLSEQSSFISRGKTPSRWRGYNHLPVITTQEQHHNNDGLVTAKSWGEPSNDCTQQLLTKPMLHGSAVCRSQTQRSSGVEPAAAAKHHTLEKTSSTCGVTPSISQSHTEMLLVWNNLPPFISFYLNKI